MRQVLFGIIFLLCCNVFSQDTIPGKRLSRTYINIKTYKEKGDPLTKQDTINFMIEGNDTLVLCNKRFY